MKSAARIVWVLFFICCQLIAREVDDPKERQPEKRGNFALPVSQQPAPLIGFGQNIMDRGDTQLFTYFDQLNGINQKSIAVTPTLLYAIRDSASLFIGLPIIAKAVSDNTCSSGVGDIIVQGEYAFFEKNTASTTNMLTCVANVTIPTGSVYKLPPTGLGAPSFFLGATANHVAVDWYYFAAVGGVITTQKDDIKSGNQFLYECGLSKNINYVTDKFIFNWMLELDGIYIQQGSIGHIRSFNSGGNLIALTPSLWLSTPRTFVQAGISWFVSQHLFGDQNKNSLYAALDFGITF